MTIDEKVKIINEFQAKNFLHISPRTIEGGARLVVNQDTLTLYENMEENTKQFVEREVVNLRTSSEREKHLFLSLVFCGDFDELPNDLGNPIDFIMNNSEKVVAIDEFVTGTKTEEFFVGFAQSRQINSYGYVYLNLKMLLEEFDKNGVDVRIDTTSHTRYSRNYDRVTDILISLR